MGVPKERCLAVQFGHCVDWSVSRSTWYRGIACPFW